MRERRDAVEIDGECFSSKAPLRVWIDGRVVFEIGQAVIGRKSTRDSGYIFGYLPTVGPKAELTLRTSTEVIGKSSPADTTFDFHMSLVKLLVLNTKIEKNDDHFLNNRK